MTKNYKSGPPFSEGKQQPKSERETGKERGENLINIMSTEKMTGMSMFLEKMWLTILPLSTFRALCLSTVAVA